MLNVFLYNISLIGFFHLNALLNLAPAYLQVFSLLLELFIDLQDACNGGGQFLFKYIKAYLLFHLCLML